MKRVLTALLFLLLVSPAPADQLAAGLSTDSIRITSSFRGADLVVFGALASDARLGDLTHRDIVVVLSGPPMPIIVRRKERVAGVWVNATEARVEHMPSFHHLAATRSLRDIASEETLKNLTLGAARLEATVGSGTTLGDALAFRDAAVRVKTRARLYRETLNVERLGSHLFRARISLPATVPPGRYRVEVYLFEKGKLVARASTVLPIAKAGLERRLADAAEDQPLPYALAAVAMALTLGWAGFATFRRGL